MKLIMMYKHREELGEQLEIVVLEMPVEEQMERVRGRNGGSQHVVDKMKVRFLLARDCPCIGQCPIPGENMDCRQCPFGQIFISAFSFPI